jgi:HD-like signal output (HDOD) protein
MSMTINQWIDRGKDLPVLSGSIGKILSLTDGAETNVSQIAEVIKRDISFLELNLLEILPWALVF